MMRMLLALVLALAVAGGTAAQTAAPAGAGTAAGPPVTAAANPYSATVPVAGTSDAQRNAAIGNALSRVLQQVAPGFVPDADVLKHASDYVRDFRYRRAADNTGLELQVDFDPGAVSRMLAANAQAGPAAGATSGLAAGTAAPQSGSGTLWVTGIDNSHAFAMLLSILRGDSALHDVVPVEAHGDAVLLQLDFDQPLAGVLAGLTGPGGHLVPATQPHLGADASLEWVH